MRWFVVVVEGHATCDDVSAVWVLVLISLMASLPKLSRQRQPTTYDSLNLRGVKKQSKFGRPSKRNINEMCWKRREQQ